MIVNKTTLATLGTAFSAAFSEGFGQAPAQHEPLTMMTPSMTSQNEYGWLGQMSSMREWLGDRTIDGLVQHGYTIKNRKFESTVTVRRDDIEDDNVGVYTPLFQELGRAAAAHPCELVFKALKDGFSTKCYDGQYFFDSDHDVEGASYSNTGGGSGTAWYLVDASRMIKPIIFQRRRDYTLTSVMDLDDQSVFKRDEFLHGVDARVNVGYGLWQLAYGSKQALTVDNYKTARTQMLSVKGDRGRPMGVMPTHLVVPPSLEHEGLKLLNAELLSDGESNVYRGTAQLIVSPWLA